VVVVGATTPESVMGAAAVVDVGMLEVVDAVFLVQVLRPHLPRQWVLVADVVAYGRVVRPEAREARP